MSCSYSLRCCWRNCSQSRPLNHFEPVLCMCWIQVNAQVKCRSFYDHVTSCLEQEGNRKVPTASVLSQPLSFMSLLWQSQLDLWKTRGSVNVILTYIDYVVCLRAKQWFQESLNEATIWHWPNDPNGHRFTAITPQNCCAESELFSMSLARSQGKTIKPITEVAMFLAYSNDLKIHAVITCIVTTQKRYSISCI